MTATELNTNRKLRAEVERLHQRVKEWSDRAMEFSELASRYEEELTELRKAQGEPTVWMQSDHLAKFQHRACGSQSMLARCSDHRLQSDYVPLYTSAPTIPEGWLKAIDEELVVTHLGVANATDSYEEARRKLHELIAWHEAVATDPSVNGGYQLMPVEPFDAALDILKGVRDGKLGNCNAYRASIAASPKHKETP